MITINNYREKVKTLDFSKQPAAIQEGHANFDMLKEFYNDDDDIKETLDLYLSQVEKIISKKSIPSAEKKAPAKKPASKKVPAKKTASVKKTSSPRKSTAKKYVPKETEVAKIPAAVALIRRYFNLHEKTVTERQVMLIFKAIQRAAAEKTVRKDDKYADLILKIGSDLRDTYNDMSKTTKFVIPGPIKKKVDAIVDEYGIRPSVALLKRFISLYGGVTPEKAERLKKSIENAIKGGKISKNEANYDRILEIQNYLKGYLKNNQLTLSPVQLNGLRGVAGLGK